MKLFVTGGSSPLGDVVLPKLCERHQVTALGRSDAAIQRLRASPVTIVRGSLEERDKWARWAQASECTVHMAGIRLVRHVLDTIDSEHPLTIIGSASARVTVHPSSSELQAIEHEILHKRPHATVLLRPTMIYGSPRDRNVRLLVSMLRRLPIAPKVVGGGLLQPVLADDVADAVLTTLGSPEFVLADIGGPAPVRLGEILGLLAFLLKKPVLPIPIPITALSLFASLVSKLVPSKVLHAVAMTRHDRVVANAEPILGRPATPLEVGLKQALDRYM